VRKPEVEEHLKPRRTFTDDINMTLKNERQDMKGAGWNKLTWRRDKCEAVGNKVMTPQLAHNDREFFGWQQQY
jgi:hypothetical protein